MEPAVAAAWNLSEPFLHWLIKEIYQRVGWEIIRGDRRPRFPCTTVRYALAGPLSDYARSRLTPPSLLDAMMASAPPRLGPVLVCTPTLESVPPPPVIIVDPAKPVLPKPEVVVQDADSTHLLLFLAGSALLIFIAYKLHQHRLANNTRINDDDDSPPAAPDSTSIVAPTVSGDNTLTAAGSTESDDNASTVLDPAAATAAPIERDTSEFWFAFFMVVMAILMG